jgi:hypothetical protein
MSPNAEEVAVLIALPASVRAELAKCEGPGWVIYGSPPRKGEQDRGLSATLEATTARLAFYHYPTKHWLPASECAILAVAHARGAIRPEVRRCDRGWRVGANNIDTLDMDYAPTGRLAALHLLARVTG